MEHRFKILALCRNHLLGLLLILVLGVQTAYWYHLRNVTPKLGILNQPPSQQEAIFYSMGDKQLYYRILALELQNAGDTFGRFTALKDYDYALLYQWLMQLDSMDGESHFIPAIASYYYSNTQRREDNRYLIDYLEHIYDQAPETKWWWLAQAIHIANHKMENKPLALRLAYKLAENGSPRLPYWAKQMPMFILEQMGEYEQAMLFLKDIHEKYDDYSPWELNFMNYFIRERLGFLNMHLEQKSQS